MKFLTIVTIAVDKMPNLASVADKVSKIPGRKVLTQYTCLTPFPGALPNTLTTIGVVEAENNEALSAAYYPIMLVGASVQLIPVLEIAVGQAATVERQFRG